MADKPLDAGELCHRVTFQSQVQTQDQTSGEMIVTWQDVFVDVPARVETLSVREFIAAQAAQSEVSARIKVRYRAGINASMRIVHRAQVYNIEGALPDARSGLEYLTIPVSAGTNDGSA